jgi:hypothetical protein
MARWSADIQIGIPANDMCDANHTNKYPSRMASRLAFRCAAEKKKGVLQKNRLNTETSQLTMIGATN